MHTLFAVPFACSCAVRLVLAQHSVPTEVRWVHRGPGRRIVEDELLALNPKAKVPTLVLPDGEVLTEMVGVLLHLDETHRGVRSPAERRRLIEWLAFVSTELHKPILAPAYDPAVSEEARLDARDRLLPSALATLADAVRTSPTLLGDPEPSGADAFAVWSLLLLRNLWPETVETPALTGYRKRMLAFGHVASVLSSEQDALRAA
ncbi:MAG: glutathione S-transferase family protein [Myxococcota bacterium]